MTRLRLLPFPTLAIALALLTLSLSPHPSQANQPLIITSDISYDIRPDSGPVHVSWQVSVNNNDPETVERESGTIFFYNSLQLPILRGSSNLSASSGPTSLAISLDSSGDGPLVNATVSFDRRLFFNETYSFSLEYDLTSVRDDSLLITPFYVFLPAITFGDQSTVTILTPADSAWEVSLEPVDCAGSGPVFTCRSSSADQFHLAAFAEVSRPDAEVTTPISTPLEGVDVTLTYFPGEEAWAQHIQDLVTAGLPVIADLYGFPHPGPPTINIAERGRQVILGYEGLTSCDIVSCDIDISPIANDVTALHELAHLWSDIYDNRWLAEGFANLIALKAAQHLGPSLIQGSTDPPAQTTLDLRLDEWGEVTYLIAATPDQEAIEDAGYDRSFRFLTLLEDTVGLDVLQQANADLAADAVPADSRRFLDALEDASGQELGQLFLEWVFPDSLAPVLEQRRLARDRLASLTNAAQAEALDPGPLEVIQADVTAWRFDDALAALDDAEAGLQLYLGLTGRLASLREAVQTAGLPFPDTIDAAVAAWQFSSLEQTLSDAEAFLTAYLRARDKVGQPRNIWQRLGLWGSDPEASLSSATIAFAAGHFTSATANSEKAYDLIEDAGAAALIRLLILLAVLAALATTVAIAIWFRRSRRGFP
ncbi:MAG: hypothetical protein IIC87_03410 [Chloroflexi bacterium]|nr:hypothetical protein [Chloroflexota bacterium]